MNEHGDISLVWEKDLLVIDVIGPFNEIGVKRSISLIQESILNQGLKSWRKMENWDEETLGSPDVVSSAREISKWYKENGCYASAIVVSNGMQQQIVDNLPGNNTKSFRDKDAALSWLNLQSSSSC